MTVELPAPYLRLHQAVNEHPLLHLARCHHLSTRGLPMAFRAMPYLVEPYIVAAREGFDVMSAAQTGKSELMVIRALHAAGWQGKGVVYILPSDRKKDEFVQTRINSLLVMTAGYRERLPRAGRGGEPQIGNLTVKRFGDGTLRFLGANVESHFVEFSADLMIVDELDQVDDPRTLVLAQDRLLESPTPPLVYQVSNPRKPRSGIAAAFAAGDMRRWHHRCLRCGHAQALDWFQSLVMRTDDGGWRLRDDERQEPGSGDPRPVCLKCGRPFERNGWRWVPTRPGAGRRSYHMTRLDILPRPGKREPMRTAFGEWVEAQADLTQVERFYWSILGLPYESADAQVTVEDLASAATEAPQEGEPAPPPGEGAVTMGVDVGARMHVMISRLTRDGDRRIRRCGWVGSLPTFGALEVLALRLRPSAFAIDAGPELHNAAGLVRRLTEAGIAAYTVRYVESERIGERDFALKVDRKAHTASVDRTQLLDACLAELRERPPARTFPRNALSVEGFSDQMRASVRQYDERRERYVWTKAIDHFWHSNAYDRVAADFYAQGGAYFSVSFEHTRRV